MSLFDDPKKLEDMVFGWSLGPYYSDPSSPSTSTLSLFVDEEGVINLSPSSPILLHSLTDPIDGAGPTPPIFSPSNLFVKGLEAVLKPFPMFGTLLLPARDPSTAGPSTGLLGVDLASGEEFVFPSTTPPGFVPCAGVRLGYADGTSVVVPNLGPKTVIDGDGGSSTVSQAPAGMVWMMRVPEGWESITPDITGRGIGEWAGF
jgi:hypothetical protein